MGRGAGEGSNRVEGVRLSLLVLLGKTGDERREAGGWKKMAGMLAKPHRRHLCQLLANETGIDHWKVSTGYGVLQILVGIGALAFRGYGNLAIVIFLGCCFAGFAAVSCFVRK